MYVCIVYRDNTIINCHRICTLKAVVKYSQLCEDETKQTDFFHSGVQNVFKT